MTSLRRALGEMLELASAEGRSDPSLMHDVASAVLTIPRTRSSFQALASRSYLHGNGFARVILLTYDEAPIELALHYWPPTTSESARMQSPHTHSADYLSHVIQGTLSEEIFEESEPIASAADRVAVYGSVPRRDSGPRKLPFIRVTHLRHVTTNRHHLSQTYAREATTIHNAYAVETDCLTICLSAEKHTQALVFYPFAETPDFSARPTPSLSPDRVASIFELM